MENDLSGILGRLGNMHPGPQTIQAPVPNGQEPTVYANQSTGMPPQGGPQGNYMQYMPMLQQMFGAMGGIPHFKHFMQGWQSHMPNGMMQPQPMQQQPQPLPPQPPTQPPQQQMQQPQQPQRSPFGIGQAVDFGGAGMASRGLTPSFLPSTYNPLHQMNQKHQPMPSQQGFNKPGGMFGGGGY